MSKNFLKRSIQENRASSMKSHRDKQNRREQRFREEQMLREKIEALTNKKMVEYVRPSKEQLINFVTVLTGIPEWMVKFNLDFLNNWENWFEFHKRFQREIFKNSVRMELGLESLGNE